jgi:hypothetical protein
VNVQPLRTPPAKSYVHLLERGQNAHMCAL